MQTTENERGIKTATHSARSLFIAGINLGERFEKSLKSSLIDFYFEAVPWARQVFEEKPWNSQYYAYCKRPSETKSFLTFLRQSLQGGDNAQNYKAAYNHAAIIWMIILDNLELEEIIKIHYSYLLKLAHTVEKLDRFARARLLEEAVTAKNYREFKEIVECELAGVHVESDEVKVYSGPASEIRTLQEFKDVTEAMGDMRPELEKVTEVIAATMHTEQDFSEFLWSSRAIAAWIAFMRRREPALANLQDNQILGEWAYGAMEVAQSMHDLDEQGIKDFEELKTWKPSVSALPLDGFDEIDNGTKELSECAQRITGT